MKYKNLLNHINKEILKESENLKCFYDYQRDKTNTELQKQIIVEQINKHRHALNILYRLKNANYVLKREY